MAHYVKFFVYGNGKISYGDNGAYYDRDPLRKIKVKTDASFQELLHKICTGIRRDSTSHQLEVFHRHPICPKIVGEQAHYALVPIIDNDDVEILMEMAESMGESWTQELFIKVHDGFTAPPNHETPQERLKKEQEEKERKKKEEAEAHLYTITKVARDEDFAEQIGNDIYFDLVDFDKVQSFRIQNNMPFNLFKEKITKEFGIPVQFQRYWLWAKRQNNTYRPLRPLTQLEEAQSVEQLSSVSNEVHNAQLNLYLEVERGVDLHPIAPPDKTKGDILLFFKHYDPEKEQLRYVGRLFVKSAGKPEEILPKLNEMAGYLPHQEIELYEEIKFDPVVMCDPVNKKTSFQDNQLGDGDIICFQKAARDVHSFFKNVHNRQV